MLLNDLFGIQSRAGCSCAGPYGHRLLGIDHVPPCVPRRYKMTDGTLQLWVEDAMTEQGRREAGKEPPRQLDWLRQKQTMRLFDALIYNFDRNCRRSSSKREWR